MAQDFVTELRFPRHDASLGAIQACFASLCQSLGIADEIRREVELALEEGLTNFFKHAMLLGTDSPVHLRIEFQPDAIRLLARASGRPFDFARLPHYQAPRFLEETPVGLGTFLIEQVMDSVKWRYVEKEGQEFEMIKRLPAPIAPGPASQVLGGPRAGVRIQGDIVYHRLGTLAEALALASAAWDLYGYAYKDLLYYPEQVVRQVQTGQLLSWIATDEAGQVLGHYAMLRHGPDDPLGEMGAAFVLPEARMAGVFRQLSDRLHADARHSGVRMAGVFRQLSDRLHADARHSGVRALYSLSVTHHIATQKISAEAGSARRRAASPSACAWPPPPPFSWRAPAPATVSPPP